MFDPAQTITESAGVTVTIGSVTGTLKTGLTGADTTTAIVVMVKDVSFNKGSDTITIGTTAAISNSAFTTKISARYTQRQNGFARQVNDGYYGHSGQKCTNPNGFACQSGETGCKLSSTGDDCSYCSKCFLKTTGAACNWQTAQTSSDPEDCICGKVFTAVNGQLFRGASDVFCTASSGTCATTSGGADRTSASDCGTGNNKNCNAKAACEAAQATLATWTVDCNCPASKKEFTSAMEIGEPINSVKCIASSTGTCATAALGTCAGGASTECTSVANQPTIATTCTSTLDSTGAACAWTEIVSGGADRTSSSDCGTGNNENCNNQHSCQNAAASPATWTADDYWLKSELHGNWWGMSWSTTFARANANSHVTDNSANKDATCK